ncbi:MAG: hypothetical protein ABI277_09230, partial [Burkholderiaceae bacterium]
MKTSVKMLAVLIWVLPLAALAQTTPNPSSLAKTGDTTPAGMESKKTTETGKSTTYPKSDTDSVMSKSAPTADREKNKITKGGSKTPDSSITTMYPSTTQKPA